MCPPKAADQGQVWHISEDSWCMLTRQISSGTVYSLFLEGRKTGQNTAILKKSRGRVPTACANQRKIWHARVDLLMVDRRKDGRDVRKSSAQTAERTGGCASDPSNGGSIALVSCTFTVHSGHYSIARDT